MNSEKTTNSKLTEGLVSIIVPTYNCGDFIGIALDSLIAQTYQNWEAIIVDDCSTDNTSEVVNDYLKREPRIHYCQMETNSGAAMARNKAIDMARGQYIAFLDSDDLWLPEKLRKQLEFMKTNRYDFTCTDYSKIDEQGTPINRIVKAKIKSDYDDLLKNCPGNSTVIYDAVRLGKFKTPNIKKRNDYSMWLQVIKKARFLYGLDEPLGSHRLRTGAISSNKFTLVKYHWKVYRELEHLSLLKSSYLIFYWVFTTVLKLRDKTNSSQSNSNK